MNKEQDHRTRVLIITIIDYERSINQRTHHLADFLAETEDVTILGKTHPPRPTFWRKLFYMIFPRRFVKKTKNVNLITVITPYGANSILGVLADIALPFVFVASLLGSSRQTYDVCIAEGPWPGVAGYVLKRIGRARILVYEDLDVFAEFIRKKAEKCFVDFMEQAVIKRSDLVICVGEKLASLRKKQSGKDPRVIPNGVDVELFSQARVKEGLVPKLIYIGSLEEWAGIDLPIKSLPKLLEQFPNLLYLILGKGSPAYEAGLCSLVDTMGLGSHVCFLGHVPYSQLPKYLREADIGIATFRPSRLMEYAFTMKVIEYMAAGLPVVGTDIGETGAILKRAPVGMAIPFSDVAFQRAIEALFRQDSRSKMAEPVSQFAKGFDWHRLMTIEWVAIQEVLNRNSSQQ